MIIGTPRNKMKHAFHPAKTHPPLRSIAQAIEEAVEESRGLTGDVLNQTVRAHVRILC